MKLLVDGLGWSVSDDKLREAFSLYGTVLDSIVMKDRDTGRSRGFGFVTFVDDNAAKTAIEKLNETELGGRIISVSIATTR